MAAPRLRPDEPWPSIPCGDLPENVNRAAVRMAATQALWALSGRRFGFTTVTLHPCTRRCASTLRGTNAWYQATAAGPWWDGWWTGPWAACGCRRNCSCKSLPTVWLPSPVAEITEVIVDGGSLTLSGADAAVRVDNYRQLRRIDGEQWPTCQDDDDPFSVTFRRGRPVPELGEIAMGELEMELALACSGGPCSFNARVKETTRKGVKEVALDPEQMLEHKRTGLKRVDLFLTAVNPNGLERSSRIYNPEAVRHQRRGT